jgi:archaeosortase A (PGF-CTERM-specific)
VEKDMERRDNNRDRFSVLFLIIPTLFVIIGLLFFPYSLPDEIELSLLIPLFGSLLILGAGFLIKKEQIASKLKMIGWILFAFYWSTRTNSLYFGEDGDIVNAFLCIAGIYVLFYIAYHEWLSLKKGEKIDCLNWAAGAAAIAGLIYFGIEKTPLAPWLIKTVAFQSGSLLNLFTGNINVVGENIFYNGSFTVSIIFACTAVQSMVLFVGMILPLAKVGAKRKCYGLLLTVVPIYFLNLIRNAFITYLLGTNTTDFYMAHNIIGKGASLIALIVLLLIVVKVLPELFDEIMHLTDLPKRNGPIERFFRKYFGRKKKA